MWVHACSSLQESCDPFSERCIGERKRVLVSCSTGAPPPFPDAEKMRSSAQRLAAYSASGRKFFVGGNWKANGSSVQVKQWVSALNSGTVASSTEVVVAPPSIFLSEVASSLRKDFFVGGQDAFASTGAHTGELPASMLKDAGLRYAIVGHSERRQKGESNEVVATKAKAAIDQGLTAIACLGESLAEREAGKTTDVVVGQLAAYAKHVADWSKVVVAYEPVWAIGTGKVCPAPIDDGGAGWPISRRLHDGQGVSRAGAVAVAARATPAPGAAPCRSPRLRRPRRCTRASVRGSTRTSAPPSQPPRASSTAAA